MFRYNFHRKLHLKQSQNRPSKFYEPLSTKNRFAKSQINWNLAAKKQPQNRIRVKNFRFESAQITRTTEINQKKELL